MTRNRRSRTSRALAGAAGAVALVGLLTVTACGAGQQAQTSHQSGATNGSGTSIGQITTRDVQIAYPARPAAPDALYQRGGNAPLRFAMVNTGPVTDRIVRITTPVATSVPVSGDPSMPPNVLLLGGIDGLTTVAPGNRLISIELTGLTAPIRAGTSIPMTFTFERSGSKTVQIPVGSAGEGEAAEAERAQTASTLPAPASSAPNAPSAQAEPGAPAGSAAPQPAPAGSR